MAAKVYLYKVEMTCEGCANTISNILKKNKGKGIQSFDVNLKEKLVTVQSTMDSNAVLELIQKSGKTVTFIGEKNNVKG